MVEHVGHKATVLYDFEYVGIAQVASEQVYKALKLLLLHRDRDHIKNVRPLVEMQTYERYFAVSGPFARKYSQ